jgi:hypothetical protein
MTLPGKTPRLKSGVNDVFGVSGAAPRLKSGVTDAFGVSGAAPRLKSGVTDVFGDNTLLFMGLVRLIRRVH